MHYNASRQVISTDRLQEGPKQMYPFTVQFSSFWIADPYK